MQMKDKDLVIWSAWYTADKRGTEKLERHDSSRQSV